MSEIKKLRVGDVVKITGVSESGLRQREVDCTLDDDMLPTATVFEKIIEQLDYVTIDHIDEYQSRWFSVDIEVDGAIQHHSVTLADDNYLELVERN